MSVFRFKRGDVNFRTDSRYPQIRNDISTVIAAIRAEKDGQMPVYAPQYDPSAIKAEQRQPGRSEEHTSELQSLMRISYAVFCLKKKKYLKTTTDKYTSRPHTIARM